MPTNSRYAISLLALLQWDSAPPRSVTVMSFWLINMTVQCQMWGSVRNISCHIAKLKHIGRKMGYYLKWSKSQEWLISVFTWSMGRDVPSLSVTVIVIDCSFPPNKGNPHLITTDNKQQPKTKELPAQTTFLIPSKHIPHLSLPSNIQPYAITVFTS